MIYAMQLSQAGYSPAVVRRSISLLIAEDDNLPPVAKVLRRCRQVACEVEQRDWKCPECGSRLVAGDESGGVCFDCEWEGSF